MSPSSPPPGRMIALSNDTPNLDAYIIGITHIHASCIQHDNTEATFLPPLSYPRMLQWWHGRFEEVTQGTRHIFVELAPISARKEQLISPFHDHEVESIFLEGCKDKSFEVAGVVALNKPVTETGAFRGEVEKLLVSPNHRQKGVAKRLMAELERVALEEGRWSLMLDTEVGSPAEFVYPKLGWVRVGIVPEHGYSPVKGKLCDELWFYKKLKKMTS